MVLGGFGLFIVARRHLAGQGLENLLCILLPFLRVLRRVHLFPFLLGEVFVGYLGQDSVDSQGRFSHVLNGGRRVLDPAEHSSDGPRLFRVGLGSDQAFLLTKAQAYQELHQRLPRRQLFKCGPVLQRVVLDLQIVGPDANVLVEHPGIQPGVLKDGEKVQSEAAVAEEGEQPVHVRAPVGVLCRCSGLGLGAGVLRAGQSRQPGAQVLEEE